MADEGTGPDPLVLYLSGDATEYEQVLRRAEADIVETVRSLEGHAAKVIESRNAALREAARITKDVMTPTEQYSAELKKLDSFLADGHITQETYNRSVAKAKSALPEAQQAQARLNRELDLARRITEAVTTPTEVYGEKAKELDALLAKSRITQETYNRAVAELSKTLPENVKAQEDAAKAQKDANEAAAKAQKAINDEIARAAQITRSVMTPTEQYNQSLNELNLLLTKGRITRETYNRAVAEHEQMLPEVIKAQEDLAKAQEESNRQIEIAAQITRSVMTPTEKYNAEVERLNTLLSAGRITQETYNRALEVARNNLPEVQRGQKAINDEMNRAAQITQRVLTPTERYNAEVAELNGLLARGRITQETYNRALEEARNTLPEVQQAQQQLNNDLNRAQQITESVLSPAQRYNRRLAELDRLLQAGHISQETYRLGLRALGREFNYVEQRARRAAQVMRDVGSRMSIGITAPLTIMGGIGVRSFAQTEQGLADLRAAANPTAEEMKRIEEAAMSLSKELKVKPDAAIEGYRELIKAGVDLDTALGGAGKAAVMFAKVGGLSVETAAVIMNDAVNVFNETAEDTANILSAAADASSIDLAQVAQSFAQASAAAAGAKQDLTDTAAAIAVLGNEGIKGSDAGTSLRTMLLRLQTQVPKAEKVVKDYGLQLRQINKETGEATGPLRPFAELIGELQAKLGGLNAEARDKALFDLFGQDAIRAANIFMKTGVEGFEDMKRAMEEAQPIQDKYAQQMDTLLGRWQAVGAALARMWHALVGTVQEEGKGFLDVIVSIIDATTEWIKENQGLVKVLVGIGIALTTIGPLLLTIATTVGPLILLVRVIRWLLPELRMARALTFGWQGAVVALTAAASYAVGSWIASWIYGLRNVNEELERGVKLNQELQTLMRKQHSNVMKEGMAIADPSKRAAFFGDALTTAKNNLEGMEGQVKRAKAEVERLAPTWLSLGQAGKSLWENAKRDAKVAEERLAIQKQIVNELEEAFKDAGQAAKVAQSETAAGGDNTALIKFKAGIAGVTEELKNQIATFGMSKEEADLYNIAMEAGAQVSQEVKDAHMAEAKALIEKLKAMEKEKDLKKEVDDLTSSLEAQVETFGKSGHELEIYKLELAGAAYEELRTAKALAAKLKVMEEEKKLTEKAKKLTEKYLSPVEKFRKEQEELTKLLDSGKITVEVFNNAMKAARKEMRQEMKVKFTAQGIEAVEAGTAEAAARLAEYRALSKMPIEFAGLGGDGAALARKNNALPVPAAKNRVEPDLNRRQAGAKEESRKQDDLLMRIATNTGMTVEELRRRNVQPVAANLG